MKIKYEVLLKLNADNYSRDQQLQAKFNQPDDAAEYAKKLLKSYSRAARPQTVVLNTEEDSKLNEYYYEK